MLDGSASESVGENTFVYTGQHFLYTKYGNINKYEESVIFVGELNTWRHLCYPVGRLERTLSDIPQA